MKCKRTNIFFLSFFILNKIWLQFIWRLNASHNLECEWANVKKTNICLDSTLRHTINDKIAKRNWPLEKILIHVSVFFFFLLHRSDSFNIFLHCFLRLFPFSFPFVYFFLPFFCVCFPLFLNFNLLHFHPHFVSNFSILFLNSFLTSVFQF